MEFSDESDAENTAQEELIEKLPKKKSTTRQANSRSRAASAAPAEKIPPTRQTRKKSCALTRDTLSGDETLACRGSSTRHLRSRNVSVKKLEFEESSDKMRADEEQAHDVLDLSIEYLRVSDTETKDYAASGKIIDVQLN